MIKSCEGAVGFYLDSLLVQLSTHGFGIDGILSLALGRCFYRGSKLLLSVFTEIMKK